MDPYKDGPTEEELAESMSVDKSLDWALIKPGDTVSVEFQYFYNPNTDEAYASLPSGFLDSLVTVEPRPGTKDGDKIRLEMIVDSKEEECVLAYFPGKPKDQFIVSADKVKLSSNK